MTIYHDKPYGLFGDIIGGIHARCGDKFKAGGSMKAKAVGHVLGFPLLFFAILVRFAWNIDLFLRE
jgi:hypothetical protein